MEQQKTKKSFIDDNVKKITELDKTYLKSLPINELRDLAAAIGIHLLPSETREVLMDEILVIADIERECFQHAWID